MHMLRQLRQIGEGFDEILLVTNRVRTGETNALDAWHLMHGLQKLHEGTFAIHSRKLMPAVEIYDLPQQRHFLHAAIRESFHLFHDVRDGPAALLTSRVGHNAEGTLHVAALHDAHKGARLLLLQRVIANRILRSLFLIHIDDGKALLIHLLRLFSADDLVHILDDAVILLRAYHEIHARLLHQLTATALRHAAHESGHQRHLAPPHHAHLAQRLLLRLIAHGAGVDQHHIRIQIRPRHGIAALDEHLRHLLGVALVHLAAVGFDMDAWH